MISSTILRRGIWIAMAAALAACDGSHGHEHSHGDDGHGVEEHASHDGHEDAVEHGHGHAEDAIEIFRFSDELELFAEHPPVVAGEEFEVLAHLTRLDDFRPVADAAVTLVLEGPGRVEARADSMGRPGIARLTTTLPAAGSWRGRLIVTGRGREDTIEGFSVVVHPDRPAAQRAAAQPDDGHGEPIGFLKEQQWQVPFATAFAMSGPVVPTVEVPGEVTTPPGGRADVGAVIAGRLVAPPAGLVRPGQSVAAGEVLAMIAPAPAAPEEGARAELAVVEAQTRFAAARAAAQRAERLIADRAIAQRELDEARRELVVAEEAVQAARRARDVFAAAATGSGAGTHQVTAPIAGVVVAVEATPGKSVAAGEVLFRIVDPGELWIRARVPEQEAARIRTDADAAFLLAGLATWTPLDVTGTDATATVVDVGRVVDSRSRTVDVIYALHDADERLRVGALVRVVVPVGEPWRGVVVPRSAVVDEDGRSLVYVQVGGEAFEERVVRVGPRSGDLVGIESGLAADERVVVRGVNVVRLTARAATAPAHGHVH